MCVKPIGVAQGLLNIDIQQKENAWRQCTTIPNLLAKLGSNIKILGQIGIIVKTPMMWTVDRVVSSSLKKYYDKGGIL
jgi:hypothetical protein